MDAAFGQCYTLWQDFLKSQSSLLMLGLSHPEFDIHVSGTDQVLPPILHSSNYSNDLFTISQKPPAQRVHMVLKQGLATRQREIEYKAKYPLVFYTSAGTSQGQVNITMSTRTHSIIQMKYNSTLLPACVIMRDHDNLPKFCLSSEGITKSVNKMFGKVLSICVPDFVTYNCSGKFHAPQFNGEKHYIGDDLYAIPCIPTIACQEWPDAVHDWISRRRPTGWPTRLMIDEMTGRGCWYVPVDGDGDSENHEWICCFTKTEEYLLKQWTMAQIGVYITLRQFTMGSVLDTVSLTAISRILMYAVFSHCEEKLTPADWSDKSMLTLVTPIVHKIKDHLTTGHYPDYFIPEINLLDKLSTDTRSLLAEQLATLTSEESQTDLSFLIDDPCITMFVATWKQLGSESRLPETDSTLKDVTRNVLSKVSSEISVLTKILINGRLYKDCIETSINLHKEMFQSLDSISSHPDISYYLAEVKSFLSTNLGRLYFAKAHRPRTKGNISSSLQLARQWLESPASQKTQSGKLNLALYEFKQDNFQKAVELLQEINRSSAEESDLADSSTNDSESSRIEEEYFLCSAMEKQVLPATLSTHTQFEAFQCLGLIEWPVILYHQPVLLQLLLAMCHIKLGNTADAVKCLTIVEQITHIGDEPDGNEKREVAYINAIAQCYMVMGEEEEVERHLQKSVLYMPNPRNPARGMLMWRALRPVRNAAKYAVFTSACAMAAVLVHRWVWWR